MQSTTPTGTHQDVLTSDNLATKKDVEDHFATHGTGTVKEIKLMNGFGFIEYEDAMDARDVVPGTHISPSIITLNLKLTAKPAFRMFWTNQRSRDPSLPGTL